MDPSAKQNLIPDDIKERYSKKYLAGFVIVVAVFLVVSIAIPYISMGIVNRQISRIERENAEYQYQQEEIDALNEEIEIFSKIINEYEATRFPFSQFLFDMEALKPASVHIISVDSPDRLINEGATDEKEKKEPEKKAEEKPEGEENTESEETAETTSSPEIKYEKDLSLQQITIRGYGSSQKDISDYLHAISELSYITKLNVVAIEEHKIENGVYNIFEATVGGWGYNENQVP